MTKKLALVALLCVFTFGCSEQQTADTTKPDTTAPNTAASSSDGETLAVQGATTAVVADDEKPPAGHFVKADPKLATLTAKFVYGGKPPSQKKIDGSKDSFCANLNILSELMVIGKKGEIQNLAFYLDTRKTELEIPKEMLEVKPATIKLDNKGCVFIPHVLFVRPGQTIDVLNSDQTGHNANFSCFNNESENFLIPAGGHKEKLFTEEEPAAIPVICNIHPWMKAHIFVKEHPYVGISDEKGEITIENLPVGEVVFRVWHENSDGSIDEVDVEGKKEKWKRGRVTVELKAGMNELGTITIAPDKFKKL